MLEEDIFGGSRTTVEKYRASSKKNLLGKTYMQDNKMMKDTQIADNPPGRLLFRNLFKEEQRMREENLFYPSVSDKNCLSE